MELDPWTYHRQLTPGLTRTHWEPFFEVQIPEHWTGAEYAGSLAVEHESDLAYLMINNETFNLQWNRRYHEPVAEPPWPGNVESLRAEAGLVSGPVSPVTFAGHAAYVWEATAAEDVQFEASDGSRADKGDSLRIMVVPDWNGDEIQIYAGVGPEGSAYWKDLEAILDSVRPVEAPYGIRWLSWREAQER